MTPRAQVVLTRADDNAFVIVLYPANGPSLHRRGTITGDGRRENWKL